MKKYSIPYFFWLLIFVVMPLALITLMAFSQGDMMNISTFSFSLDNFVRFFEKTYLSILKNSLVLAAVSTVLCFIIGYPAAFIISRQKEKLQNILILLFVIPMWMNFLLRTYAWLSLLGSNGLINKFFGLIGLGPFDIIYNNKAILLGMVYNFLPYMVLPIYTVLNKMDESLVEAARDLGASEREVFTKVIFPLSLAGVSSGVIMVFIPALSTFVISSLLGGNKAMLIGNVIEQQFRFTGDWHFGSAISMILVFLMFIWIIVSSKLNIDRESEGGLW
ncbi:ABC transporter permease [Neofamilia massiliensis]|uniref:ABC transporter permease n=1 Tax=Neofamilia massiliensis TaxID=1673724 RepID=UPI0006BB7EE9|nr:ABC transporter permease [Neofamilia massiliensis]